MHDIDGRRFSPGEVTGLDPVFVRPFLGDGSASGRVAGSEGGRGPELLFIGVGLSGLMLGFAPATSRALRRLRSR